MFNFNTKSLALVVSLLIVSSISGYLVYASVWLGPPGIAPGNNVSQPINIGTTDQDKTGRISAVEFYDADDSSFYINPSGNSSISGELTIGGDISDGSKTIYDSTSGRLDYSVLPYEKGDLTSDWASNSYTSGYYDVSNITVTAIACGTSFGRGQTGTNTDSCVAGDEGCRHCDSGVCGYYTSGQHGCATNYECNASGSCVFQLSSDYCSAHSGAVTEGADNIFCGDNLMWSTTLAAGYQWGHYGAVVGNCTSSSDSSYPACYACNTLDYAGFTDWYLPSKDVLLAIVGDIGLCPANGGTCDNWDSLCCTSSAPFPSYYWSSTEYISLLAWHVGFGYGGAPNYYKNSSFSVRCVRP